MLAEIPKAKKAVATSNPDDAYSLFVNDLEKLATT